MYDLVISGGTLVDRGVVRKADLAITNGRVAAVAEPGTIEPGRARVEDADGLHVLPGLVDAHVHVRDPDASNPEDFGSATRAAAAGGVTTVFAMPNTAPPAVVPEVLREVRAIGAASAVVDFALVAGVDSGGGERIGPLADAGAVAFDILDPPFENGTRWWVELLDAVARSGRRLGLPIDDAGLPEATDPDLSGLLRALPLAHRTGAAITLRQLSAARELDALAALLGLFPDTDIVVETCPHYLYLTYADAERLGARAKMIPPLRAASDQAALWSAIRRGVVDYVGSDHAPHDPVRKDGPDAPSGIVGLETLLPLLLTSAAEGRVRIEDAVRLCSEAPARAYGLYPRKGSIAVGADADLVLVDAGARWTFAADATHSRGAASPFDGWELTGRPLRTLVGGRRVMEAGEICAAPAGRDVGREQGRTR